MAARGSDNGIPTDIKEKKKTNIDYSVVNYLILKTLKYLSNYKIIIFI